MQKRSLPWSIIIIYVIVCAVMVSSIPGVRPVQADDSLHNAETTAPSVPNPEGTDTEPTIPEPSEPETEPPTEPVLLNVSGLTARDAFVYDSRVGEYLHLTGDPHAHIYPASITKLFSVYVALMYLDVNDVATVGAILDTVPSDSSTALLDPGDRLSVGDLIRGMILPSGGDAARVLAVAAGKVISGKPDQTELYYFNTFVDEMNRQAKLLGMNDSHFVNSDGYHDPEHYISMADAVHMVELCLDTPFIMECAATTVYMATVRNTGRKIQWVNTNKMLFEQRYPELYSSHVLGLKTGFTSDAGGCMLSVFRVDGGYLYIGVFGCERGESRFQDTLALFKAAK